jgi:tetratricopeptide (TPR) repeat protein
MAQEPAMEQGSSEAAAADSAPGPRLAGKWQIPLLMLSVVCFVAALLFAVLKPPSEEVGPEALARLAEAALASGDYVRADELCEQFLAEFPRELQIGRIQEIQGDANFALGAATFKQPQDFFNKAARAYRGASSMTPGELPSPSILAKLGDTYRRLSKIDEASEWYDKALQSDPADPFLVHLAKIETLRDSRQDEYLKEALRQIALVRQTLKDLPADRQTTLALHEAGVLNAQGNHVAAERRLRDLLERSPDQVSSARFLIELADTQRRAGHHTQALDTLQKVINEPAPRSTDTEYLRGQAFLLTARTFSEMANLDQALHWFQRTANEYPEADESLAARLGIAETYLQLGELGSASKAYASVADEIRKLPPGGNRWINIDAAKLVLANQSECSEKSGNYRDALQFVMLEESILANPDRNVRLNRARILLKLAQAAGKEAEGLADQPEAWKVKRLEAERSWREAGDDYLYVAEQFDGTTQKDYPDDIYQAAQCFVAAGAHARAVELLSRFLKEVPSDGRVPQVRLELARQYEALRQWDKAIETLQALKEVNRNTLAAFEGTYLLGKVYFDKGPEFYKQAEDQFRLLVESAQVDPKNQWYRQSLLELGRLLFRRQEYDQAIMRLSEYILRYPDGLDTLSAKYLQASSVRHQGLAALAKSREEVRPHDKDALLKIHDEKLRSAVEEYRRLIVLYEQLPGPPDALRRQEYHNVMFELADSLFELGLTEEARQAYNVIVYRFENMPAVMQAYVQLMAIYQGLGQKDQLLAVLERARWTLEKIPAERFAEQTGGPSKAYWQDWLQKVRI